MTIVVDDMIVAKVNGRDVTRGALVTAFDRVANKEHWKFPIDATVDVANDFELGVIREAVIFFTGSVPTFEPRLGGELPGCRYRVRAAGYFRTIGA